MSTTTATTAIPDTAISTESAVDRTGQVKLTPEQLDAFGAELDAVPADLRLPARADPRAGRFCDQLRAEADAEQRKAALDQRGEKELLVSEPWVRKLLVDMHRSAEGEHRIVGSDRPGRRLLLRPAFAAT